MKRMLLSCVVAGVAGLGGPVVAQERAPRDAELIPRDVLFGNPDRASVKLSPDGEKISFLAERDGVLNVFIAPAADVSKAEALTSDTDRGIRQYFWSYTNDHIVYLQDRGGDENWRAYSVDIGTGQEIDLTPMDGVAARIQGVSHERPDEILIGINNRDERLHDLFVVNVRTGERELVEQNPGFLGFVTDDEYDVRFAVTYTPQASVVIAEKQSDGGWVPFMEIPSEDSLTTSPAGFDKSGTTLYMMDSRGRDTAALVALDLTTGDQRVVAADDRADISGVLAHPTERTIEAYSVNHLKNEWFVLDPSIEKDLERMREAADGAEVSVTSRTLDDSMWTFAAIDDDGPVRYYMYDRDSGEIDFLFTNRESLKSVKLAPMHPRVIESRDGKELVSYLTVPWWTDRDADGVPTEPLPMVLWVHGGPWARDSWGYNSYHQWMANRGYAVLSVNFRGSTGFGKSFINAGDGEWSKSMHDDLIDAVEWAVAEGIADADRVAIGGGSYGGYATLVGLTFTPEVFACGVDIVGPSNLITLMENIPPYWAPFRPQLNKRVGDPSTVEGRRFLRSVSPLTHVDEIVRPLLIGQGANDPRVNQVEADQIVDAMVSKNIPVTYVLFPDEGHGFAKPENRMAFNSVMEVFLAQHLGGRYEPIDDDVAESSAEVPTGAEDIPGLGGVKK